MDNMRGSALMVAAMLGFAVEDVLIKQLALDLPMGQVVALIGCGGAAIFAILTRASMAGRSRRGCCSRAL